MGNVITAPTSTFDDSGLRATAIKFYEEQECESLYRKVVVGQGKRSSMAPTGKKELSEGESVLHLALGQPRESPSLLALPLSVEHLHW